MKYLIFVLLLVFLVACATTSVMPGIACTMEAKLCPDGSAVGRSGPNCEFAPCPEVNPKVCGSCPQFMPPAPGWCEYGTVIPGAVDECGCRGHPTCELSHVCSEASKSAQVCDSVLHPVCGWMSEKIKCFKYPCAINAANPCEACKNENVVSWTDGQCPS